MVVVLKPLDEEARETLHGAALSIFLHGECYAFAIALNRGTEWPMVGLGNKSAPDHVGVQMPSGMICDVRGAISKEEFGEPFGKPPYTLHSVSEENLRAVRPISKRAIAIATRMAEAIWPDLGWKNPRVMKVRAFLEDLEKLSRAHGMWFRGAFPGSLLILGEAFGEEEGYAFTPTFDGSEYAIDRQLKSN